MQGGNSRQSEHERTQTSSKQRGAPRLLSSVSGGHFVHFEISTDVFNTLNGSRLIWARCSVVPEIQQCKEPSP